MSHIRDHPACRNADLLIRKAGTALLRNDFRKDEGICIPHRDRVLQLLYNEHLANVRSGIISTLLPIQME